MVWLKDYLSRMRSKYKINFTIYEDPDVNAFFWVTCLLGGILSSQKVNRSLKRIWLVYHIIAACVIVSLNIGGFLQQTDIRSWLRFAEISKPFLSLPTLYATYALFYYNQQNIERYMDDVNTHLRNLPPRAAGTMPCPVKSTSFFKFFDVITFIMFLINGIPFFFPLFEVLQTKSYILLFATAFAQFTSILPCILSIFLTMTLERLFLTNMTRAFDAITEQIRYCSETAQNELESSHNEELVIERRNLRERNRTALTFTNRRKRIEDRFEKEIVCLVKRYQNLMKIRGYMNTLIEILFTIVSTVLLAVVILFGKDVLWVTKHPMQVYDFWMALLIFSFGILFHFIYRLCNFANSLDNMVETVSFEVYSSPWYLLSKRTRKMIYILMVQTQNPYRFKMYKITPIELSLLPKFFNLCYKYSSVLEAILAKSK